MAEQWKTSVGMQGEVAILEATTRMVRVHTLTLADGVVAPPSQVVSIQMDQLLQAAIVAPA
ncbi:MAG: hypothetical protein Q7T57_03930 [Dehalococcoidales bacterium]|nr:hypothetical protein [Dehalococcoidales bacterium]